LKYAFLKLYLTLAYRAEAPGLFIVFETLFQAPVSIHPDPDHLPVDAVVVYCCQ
jgi:hypothetical protein